MDDVGPLLSKKKEEMYVNILVLLFQIPIASTVHITFKTPKFIIVLLFLSQSQVNTEKI